MKALITGTLLVILSFAPSLVRAAPPPPPAAEMATSPVGSRAGSTPAREATGYAAREQASPQLAQFQGGSAIYIGGGALTVVLIVLLILILL